MENLITGSDLLTLGFVEGREIGEALRIAQKLYRFEDQKQLLENLRAVRQYPNRFLNHEHFGPLAALLTADLATEKEVEMRLLDHPLSYAVYGAKQIEQGAINQMDVAMKLPVSVTGALMPDAHQGYGLPIGGVLGVRNAVIPYGVGVDIGCRMALTIFDISEKHFDEHAAQYKRELIAHTKFGAGAGFMAKQRSTHAVLDHAAFREIAFLKQLKDKAYDQLGTSGGGNHFVEWGIIDFKEDDKSLNIDSGKYLALLSHSGSRGLGATIAGYYTKKAKEVCRLPKEAANLAYLDLNTELGQEYWLAMNLAGAYASACHDIIHEKLVKAVGGQILAKIENHHNFAWKEVYQGEELIIHRKGATPATKGVMGIIPGSMTAPGFLVRGKGNEQAVNSASHGAGRQMSRTKAVQQLKREDMRMILKEHGVTLIGAGLDEAPMAYKDIHTVMAAQRELVDVIATFFPKMVRMADDGSRED